MKKNELRDVLDLVKDKLSKDAETGCGLFWADEAQPTSRYSVGEEDVTTYYAVGEEDNTVRYAVPE